MTGLVAHSCRHPSAAAAQCERLLSQGWLVDEVQHCGEPLLVSGAAVANQIRSNQNLYLGIASDDALKPPD